jgi:hypothetical protein
MDDWREQLKNVYEVLRDRKKATKPSSTTKFDQEVNFKGRAGYNDTGIPLSPKTIKKKNKNKSMYAARARAKYWSAGSQLKNINDRRAADAALKYGVKAPEAMMPDPMVPDEFKPAPVTRFNTNYSRYNDSGITHKVYNYYDPVKADDGSIEVVPNRIITEPKFRNKVEEEIWRLKNKKI